MQILNTKFSRQKVLGYLLVCLLATPLGICIGVFITIFGDVLMLITEFRTEHFHYLLPFMCIAGYGLIYLAQKLNPNATKGMSHIFTAYNKNSDRISILAVPFVTVATWVSHLFGASAGREGVAIQIGASISDVVSAKFENYFPPQMMRKLFLVSGMSAGFAALFQTPLAATVFACEVLIVHRIQVKALLPASISAFAGYYTSNALDIERFKVNIDSVLAPEYSHLLVLKLCVLAVACTLAGMCFSTGLQFFKAFFARLIPDSKNRILIIGAVLSVLLLLAFDGRYSGLSTDLMSNIFYHWGANANIGWYDWILKLLFTVLCLAAGYFGGEVTPIFIIGSCLGFWISPLIQIPAIYGAAIGCVTVFASCTNTVIAPALIAYEIFGAQVVPSAIFCTLLAFCLNFNKTIYPAQQIAPLLNKPPITLATLKAPLNRKSKH